MHCRCPLRVSTSLLAVFGLILAEAQPAAAYGVLSHEAIIDAAWKTNIRPLLEQRFPNATKDELRQAHAYAYGGSIIQDMGYYPYGKKLFSDLTHYVRSGDFVLALLRDAEQSHQLNDLAFALGALAHYAADNEGHRLAVNVAVPLLYPHLRKKYGDTVTYEDDPLAHIKTEFGFDVLEVAKGRYAPDAYHDFIGFEVAKPLLDRAFEETYGLNLGELTQHEEKAINSYRHDVSTVIPRAVKVAWAVKEDDIKKDQPGITRKKFLYNLSRASFEKRWGKDYRRPNFVEKFYAFLFRLIPKFGPLRVLTFRTPTPQTEKLFEDSFNATLDRYRHLLDDYAAGRLQLPNDNIDTGSTTPLGKYHLADVTYAGLLDRLAQQNFAGADAKLRADILAYFASPPQPAPYESEKLKRQNERLQQKLNQLRSASAPAAPSSASP
jgi:hypothetical protein